MATRESSVNALLCFFFGFTFQLSATFLIPLRLCFDHMRLDSNKMAKGLIGIDFLMLWIKGLIGIDLILVVFHRAFFSHNRRYLTGYF